MDTEFPKSSKELAAAKEGEDKSENKMIRGKKRKIGEALCFKDL